MAAIVVLGAGLGGMSAAYELQHKLGKKHEITVVGEGPRFAFTPSNPWVAVGWRKPEKITLDAGKVLRRRGIRFIDEPAVKLVAAENRLITAGGTELRYDYLVITTGARLAFDKVPGLGPDAHTHSVCTTEHAERAWRDWQAFVEAPGPLVIGAAAGVSCFGPAYETAMIMDTDLRKRRIRDQVPMTFITSEPYIGHMGLGGVGDSKGLLESELRQRHIQWIANARVTHVDEKHIHVEELDQDGELKARHELPFAYSMIMPAFAGVDVLREVEGLVNPRGFVLIDEHQRNPTWPNIYGAGVCVAIPPVEATPVPTGAPKTGLMIESMVSAIVENIDADLRGEPVTAEATWNALCLADFGDTGAAFLAIPQIPPRNVTWTKKGRWVHLAKIAFEKYFLRKMRKGRPEPIYEKYIMKRLGVDRIKSAPTKR